MSINRGMDKEDVAHIYTVEYYSAIKNNEIMPFAATWMDLQVIILRKVSETEKDKYITHMWNLIFLNDINEIIYKTETRLTDFENKVMVTKGETRGGGIN